MRKRKMTKRSKKRLIIFGTASVIIIAYFFISFFYYLYGIYDRKKQEASYNTELKELKREEKILKTEIEKLKDEDYIARYAREKYSYSKDGEYILKIPEAEKKKKDESKFLDTINYKYIIYGGCGVILLIFIHILKKKK